MTTYKYNCNNTRPKETMSAMKFVKKFAALAFSYIYIHLENAMKFLYLCSITCNSKAGFIEEISMHECTFVILRIEFV